MHQYNHYLLSLVLVISSATIALPSQAQNLGELNPDNTNNNALSTTSEFDVATDKNVQPQLDNASSVNNNQSDLSTKALAASTEQATTNPNPRIPISSRIFPAASMQQ